MGITTAILDSTVAPAAAAKKAFAPSKAKRERAIQKLRAQIAEKACDDAPNSGGTDEAKAHRAVEMVAVYDHPRLLRDAMSTARKRLNIISPLIHAAGAGRVFIGSLTN